VHIFFLLASAVILAYLTTTDLRFRRLPNRWVVVLAVLYPVHALLAPQTGWPVVGWHVLTGLLAFVLLFILYVLGAMGGGDVKLGAAVYLWAGPALALPVTVIVAWLGGLLAIAGWLVDRPGLQRFTNRPWRSMSNALSARRGVPYGVALAVGGLFVLWRHVPL